MAAHHLTVRSAARPLAAVVPRRAVLRVALAALAALAVGLGPGLAHGQEPAVRPYRGNLNFINQTDTTLWIAISYLDKDNCGTDGWVAKGWWGVAPGEITAVLRLSHNDSTHFYYYAYGEDGTTFFKGSSMTYVDEHERFFWCEPAGGSRPDIATVGMRDLVIDSEYTTYTLRLGSDRDVPIEEESSRSVPFEPADQPELDADGCWISGGVRQCPAYD